MARTGRRREKRSGGLLIVSGHKVLVVRRSAGSSNGGTWGLPGGQRDRGESALEAAHREALEELGPLPPLDVVGRLRVQRARVGRYVVFVARCGSPARERWVPRLDLGEHDAFAWVRLAWLVSHRDDLHPVLRRIVDRPVALRALAEAIEGAATVTPGASSRRRDPTIDVTSHFASLL